MSVRLPSWMSPLSLLAVLGWIADQVEQVILDLERRTGEKAEPDEAIEIHIAPRADQARPHASERSSCTSRSSSGSCAGSPTRPGGWRCPGATQARSTVLRRFPGPSVRLRPDMRMARGRPSGSALSRSAFKPTKISASPTFTAIGDPCSAFSVGLPRRVSLSSSTSSWTRKALCSISMATAVCNASSSAAPKARAVARQRLGRSMRPPRRG